MKVKNSIITLAFIMLVTVFATAQDRGPSQRGIILYPHFGPVMLSSEIYPFSGPDSLVIGFQWPNNLSVAKALYCNQNSVFPQFMVDEQFYQPDPNKAQNGAYLTLNGLDARISDKAIHSVFTHCLADTGILHAKSLTFKPNMKIDEGDNQYQILAKRPYDIKRPILGFNLVDTNALANNVSDSGNVNYGCLLINNQSFINRTIFEKPWGLDFLRKIPVKVTELDTSKLYIMYCYGYNFIVSVNVKRLGNNYPLAMNSSAALTINLAYQLHNDTTGFINFEYIPSDIVTDIRSSYNEYRGRQTGYLYAPEKRKDFNIRGAQLDNIGETVTVSAKFKCWGVDSTDKRSNPQLSSLFETPLPGDIKKLNIIAIYKGVCPIGIESVTISTPQGKKLLEGKMDTRICEWLQDDIDLINAYNDSLPEKKLKIFKFNDITESDVQNYAAARYIRELIGDVFSGSNSPKLPVLFDHYVQPSGRVYGFGTVNPCINAPYIKQGQKYVADSSQGLIEDRWKSLGFICGSTQKNNYAVRLTLTEQMNSGYETFYPYKQPPSPDLYTYNDFQPQNITTYNIYGLKCFGGDDSPFNSFQAFHQFNLWYLFANDTASGFQYLDKPWYFQTQNLTEWTKAKYTCNRNSTQWTNLDLNSDSLKYSYKSDSVSVEFEASTIFSYGRPYTAEELRAVTSSALMQGAKGLLYDGLSYIGGGTEYAIRSAHNKGLLDNPLEADDDPYDYLMRNEYGGDFFNFVNEGTPGNPLYFHFFPSLYINMLKSTVDKDAFMMENLGVHYNRVYIGRKSTRIELHKIHRILMENASAFMEMKLLGWRGKGMFFSYNQHPSFPLEDSDDTLLDKYVRLRDITTRKVFQPQLSDSIYSTVPYSTVEPVEEQYYDLSLFQCGSEDINIHHRLAIQNRRTDPLRLRYTGIGSFPRDLYFYTAAEMDSLSDYGGIDPLTDSSHTFDYWRKIYRQSNGYREISLPIRRLRDLTNQWGYLVKDLTYKYPARNSTEFENMKYWLRDAYDHQVHQFIPCTYAKAMQYDTVSVKLRPAEAKFLDIKRYYKVNDIKSDIVRKNPTFPPPPTTPLDTCEILTNGMGLYFKRCDTTDANNCLYEIYFINKTDSLDFYVPLIIDFQSENNKDTIIGIPSGFQNVRIRRYNNYQNIWLPDTLLSDTTFLGYYKPNCSDSRVTYKFGSRDCYSSGIIELQCGICSCCDSLSVGVQPVTLQNFCRVYPTPYQRLNLNSDEDCDYYGILVTGGFSPMDSTIISALSIMPDTTNPQPIDISAYNRYIEDPFMNIYCPTVCSYCLHFAFLGSEGQILCEKDFCITIDNTQYPIDIDPYGILSSQCYSIQPAKRAVPSEEIHSGQMIIIDPNPTSGKANVRLNLENDLNGRLVLYTATGELIKEIFTGTLKKGSSDYQIDLSSQPSGMYIITIESDGMQYIKKFVKE